MIFFSYLLLTVFVYMACWFIVAIALRDNGIADIAWGIGFICIAVVLWSLAGSTTIRQYLLNGLTVIWGIRLAVHILVRNNCRPEEDFRYKQWREAWGKRWQWRTFWQVFMLQGFFMCVIAQPIFLGNTAAVYPAAQPLALPSLGMADILGILLFVVGFLFEAIGDYQLLRFKQNQANKGRIMTLGLWKYTRHPNYFGEMLLWWGMAFIAAASGHRWALSAFISPIVLTWLLLRVSGVPMLEKKYAGNPEFEQYARQTPAFFPRFW